MASAGGDRKERRIENLQTYVVERREKFGYNRSCHELLVMKPILPDSKIVE